MTATTARRRLSWPNARSLAFLIVLGVVFFRQPFDLDYCWQVRTGEHILDSGKLREPDHFSYTIAGKDVPDHEWLYEGGLALIWRGLGDAGLRLARVILFLAPIAILVWQLRQRNVPDYAAVLVGLIVILILFNFARLRPMVCSTIGLQLVAGWLHDHCSGRRRLDWRLPVTMLIWGNLHPAIIMGQALIVGTIAWEWLVWHFQSSENRKCEVRNPKSISVWGLLGLGASMIAPAPVDRFLYPFKPELRDPAQRLFVEIQPPWQYLGTAYAIWIALVLGVVFGFVLIVRRREIFGWEWALILAVTGLAVTAVRGLGDWLVITAALAVPQIGPLLLSAARMRKRWFPTRAVLYLDRDLRRALTSPLLRSQPVWTWCSFGLIVVLGLLPWGNRLPNREDAEWPTGAADWLAASHLPTPAPWKVFSGPNEGSYLIWRLDGQALVYSDTRGFYYPGQVISDSVFLTSADDVCSQRLQRVFEHGTEFFLLPAKDGFWQKLEPHVAAPLYRDQKHVILSEQQVRSAAIAAGLGDFTRDSGRYAASAPGPSR